MRSVLTACVLFFTVVLATPPIQADESRLFVRGSFAEILKHHEGKPLVVNFWSVTCPPCMAEMPLWKNLRETSPEIGFVLVATDSPEQESRIDRILNRYGLAEADSWVFADPFIERLRYDVDKKWRGELPRTYFIDKNGNQTGHSGIVEAAALKAWVAQEAGP